MATPASDDRSFSTAAALEAAGALGGGRGIKVVPETRPLRDRIRRCAEQLASRLDKTRPMVRHELQSRARAVLAEEGLPECYLGWTMVALASAFWRQQVAAVPVSRRLLLLPHCLRSTDVCTAPYNELGLLCKDCGACCLSQLRQEAHQLGYKVMIAEGSPAVMRIILSGQVDAVLGVACLDALERTLDKVLLAGIPCMAEPLTWGGCHDTAADVDCIRQMIHTPFRPATLCTRTYLHLMRTAARMFEPAQLQQLVPRVRGGPALAETDGQGLAALDPLAATEAIAYDFLTAGGKHSRPFITLAVYDALTGGGCTSADGASAAAQLPEPVKRVALAIEIFHKASLIHDDVEDEDDYRYGRPTLHQRFGAAVAINVGDYLLGLGYRLVAAQREFLGAECIGDVLAEFASAHARLAEGQGAELIWRRARGKRITPLEALRIYALKTAPAFEAAMMAGARLAGPTEAIREPVARFARHLGVAYQLINDLEDWQLSQPNKRTSGGDLLSGRPTVLWALAMKNLAENQQAELEQLASAQHDSAARLARAAELYAGAGVFRQATELIAEHHSRACQVAAQVSQEPLRSLMFFLADAILDRRPLSISEE